MHNYTDNNAFPNPVQVIDDTDPPNASNMMTASEGALDRTRFLYQRLISSGVYALVAREELYYEGTHIDVRAAAGSVSDPGIRTHTNNVAVALLTGANTYNIQPNDLLDIRYSVPYYSGGGAAVNPVVGVGFSATGLGTLTYPFVFRSEEFQTTPDLDNGGHDQGIAVNAAGIQYNFCKSALAIQEVIGTQKIVLAIYQPTGGIGTFIVTQGIQMSIAQYRQVVP